MPTFSNTGPVWVVNLAHTEAEAVEGVLGTVAAIASPLPGAGPFIAAAVGAAAGVILAVDAIGGDNGVEVIGVLGAAGVVVTPGASSMYGTLVQGAQVVVAGATIAEFILKAGTVAPPVGSGLGISVASKVFSEVASGTPLGWALAAAGGAIVNLLNPTPDPNQHGGVHADRTVVGEWERFVMIQYPPGNQIALMSWQGLFSAQGAGGADVYANRVGVGPWETWRLIRNQDGSISIQTNNGHYLTALNGGGGGSYCLADRTAIGPWERFYLEFLPSGQVAIKTHDKRTYLSVQPGK